MMANERLPIFFFNLNSIYLDKIYKLQIKETIYILYIFRLIYNL